MKKNFLDILACPIDKHYPLELIELDVKEEVYSDNNNEKDQAKENDNVNTQLEKHSDHPKNEKNGSRSKDKNLKDNHIQEEQISVIIDGILYCEKCSRFYPIIDEIPIMLPDELREKNKDLKFLEKWQKDTPEKILKFAKPWHL